MSPAESEPLQYSGRVTDRVADVAGEALVDPTDRRGTDPAVSNRAWEMGAMTAKISISLYELAYGCHLYGATTGFDRALSKARRALHPEPDLLKPEHRDATLEFLRAWGCRHLALADKKPSSDALQSWTRAHAAELPKPGRSVETLSDGELAAVARAYAALAARRAGQHARFGPVAAAKTLFLLQPHTCPPWDNAIREYLSCDDSAAGYQRTWGYAARRIMPSGSAGQSQRTALVSA